MKFFNLFILVIFFSLSGLGTTTNPTKPSDPGNTSNIGLGSKSAADADCESGECSKPRPQIQLGANSTKDKKVDYENMEGGEVRGVADPSVKKPK